MTHLPTLNLKRFGTKIFIATGMMAGIVTASHSAVAAPSKSDWTFSYSVKYDGSGKIVGAVIKEYIKGRYVFHQSVDLKNASVHYVTESGQLKAVLTFKNPLYSSSPFSLNVNAKLGETVYSQKQAAVTYQWADGTFHTFDYSATSTAIQKDSAGNALLVVTYADGAKATLTGNDATIYQSKLKNSTGAFISDPNTIVAVDKTGETYNLVHGTADTDGPDYAASLSTLSTWHKGDLNTFKTSPDVAAAYNEGWTGLGRSVVHFGSFASSRTGGPNPSSNLADDIRFNDGKYGVANMVALFNSMGTFMSDYSFDTGIVGYGNTPENISNNTLSQFNYPADLSSLTSNENSFNKNRLGNKYYFDVVTLNEEELSKNAGSGTGIAPINQQIVDILSDTTTTPFKNAANSPTSSSTSVPVTFSDAVIVSGAGLLSNDSPDLTSRLLASTALLDQTIFVGALQSFGTAGPSSGKGGTGILYTGSNGSGSATRGSLHNALASINLSTMESRFLVASGASGTTLYDPITGKPLASQTDNNGYDVGAINTVNAAALVGAYAAIIRQKFPNLTAANTADILLSTARYDTLSCSPTCDKSIYGQGEASLSRALAPVGYLR